MSVYRIYAEKKPGFDVEAKSLLGGIKNVLGIKTLENVRIINRYDAQGLTEESFKLAVPVVFSEPAVDVVYSELPKLSEGRRSVEFNACQQR